MEKIFATSHIFQLCQKYRLRFFTTLAICLLSLISAYMLIGVQLNAGFWIIDDHELITYYHVLEKNQVHPILEVPVTLFKGTEVGLYGIFPRYRPTYFGLRLTELAIWGLNPQMWYLTRVVMFAVFIAAMWSVFTRTLGGVLGSLIAIYMLTYQYLGAVWACLGPGEQYASVGFALFLLGCSSVYEKLCQSNTGKIDREVVLLWIGSFLAMGSKENFLILVLPLSLILVFAVHKRRIGPAGILLIISALVYAVLIAGAVGLALSKTGSDIYGNSSGVWSRLIVAMAGSRKFLWPVLIPAALVILGGLLLGRKYGSEVLRSYWRSVLLAGALGVALMLMILWEFTFYNGKWPTGGRYRFSRPPH